MNYKKQERSSKDKSVNDKLVRLVVMVAGMVVFTAVARARGYSGIGRDTVVRCNDGHLYTTIWIPGASVKSWKMGWKRFQYCPVGKHWSVVSPVKDSDLDKLSEKERAGARQHDVRVP